MGAIRHQHATRADDSRRGQVQTQAKVGLITYKINIIFLRFRFENNKLTNVKLTLPQ